jgi:acetyl-CoA C-acetyltransferase
MSVEAICNMAAVAGRLSVFDCAGVADGSAAAIVVRAEDAHKYTDNPIYVKALSVVSGNGSGLLDPEYDYTTFRECAAAADDAYAQAGITDPRRELALAEVHDCFTPTELVLMEDLRFAERGQAWKEELAGTFDLTGDMPINTDGGLKSFGHPVGASGLRMLYEVFLQLRKEVPAERAIQNDRKLGLTHNLGGYPGEMVSFVGIFGSEPSA